jgi:putative thioredoxin
VSRDPSLPESEDPHVSDTTIVRDVTEAGFSADVLEASRTRPVVVDFWAPWCGPCRQLSPMLEAAAGRWAGQVDVVKVNVDEAPNLSRAFRIQGIPAVKAFRDGKLVAEFTGVQPAAVIEQLFAGLAPSEADRLAERAANATGDDAERWYRAALEEQADHPLAVVGLARLLIDRGEDAEARALLARAPSDPEARRLLAELALGNERDAGTLDALRERVERGDQAARVELGRALAAAGDADNALAVLVAAASEPDIREDARAAAVEVFELLGDADPRVRAWRPKLAAALF